MPRPIFGGRPRRPFRRCSRTRAFTFVGAVLTGQQLLAIATAAVLTAGFELVRRGTLFGKIGMATAADPGDGDRDRRQHDRRRDRRLRRLGLLCRRGRPPDRADNFRQSLSRRHIRHVRFHRDDDRRRNRKTDRRDVRRPPARRLRRGRERHDQFAGLRLVSLRRPRRRPDRLAARLVQRGKSVPAARARPLRRRRPEGGRGNGAHRGAARRSALGGAGFKPRAAGHRRRFVCRRLSRGDCIRRALGPRRPKPRLVAAVFGILAISLDLVAGMLGPLFARPGRLLRDRRLFHDDRRQRSQLERLPRPSDRAADRRPHRARGRRDVAEGQRALFRDHHLHFHARADGAGDRSQDHWRAARIAWPRISRLSGGSRGARRARSLGASCSLCSCASASFGASASRRSIRCSCRFATPNASRRRLARALRSSRSACSASPPRWLAPPDGCSRSSASFRPVNSTGRCR